MRYSSGRVGPHYPAPPMWMSRNCPPRTLDGFHGFVLDILEQHGVPLPRIVAFWRTNAPRENPPHFRGVGVFRVDQDSIQILKNFAESKGIPGSHGHDDFEWKTGPLEVSWIRLKEHTRDAVDEAVETILPLKEESPYREPPVAMLV